MHQQYALSEVLRSAACACVCYVMCAKGAQLQALCKGKGGPLRLLDVPRGAHRPRVGYIMIMTACVHAETVLCMYVSGERSRGMTSREVSVRLGVKPVLHHGTHSYGALSLLHAQCVPGKVTNSLECTCVRVRRCRF
jgi:hypothetical protein